MRQVEIKEMPRTQHPWVAIDCETKLPVLRMQRLEALLRISEGLGWEVVMTETTAPSLAAVA
jgi:hypothetical protein